MIVGYHDRGRSGSIGIEKWCTELLSLQQKHLMPKATLLYRRSEKERYWRKHTLLSKGLLFQNI